MFKSVCYSWIWSEDCFAVDRDTVQRGEKAAEPFTSSWVGMKYQNYEDPQTHSQVSPWFLHIGFPECHWRLSLDLKIRYVDLFQSHDL